MKRITLFMMRSLKGFCCAIAILAASAAAARSQVIFPATPPQPQLEGRTAPDERDYANLVREIFAPVTDELNLTNEQRFKIVAIVTGAVIKADPLMARLDELDDQISAASLAEVVDEAQINQLSRQEGDLMAQIISIKARAKSAMYRLLTPQQRSVIAKQFPMKRPPDASLGSISNE